MESKISKAQSEVWEWKEKAYQEIKDLPKSEQLKYILTQTKQTVEILKAKKDKNWLKSKVVLPVDFKKIFQATL